VNPKRIVLGICATAAVAAASLANSSFMDWEGAHFGAIPLADITTRNGTSTGSATLGLDMNGDAQISADNSANAQLRGPNSAALQTEYALSFDGNGTNSSGAPNVPYAAYSSFLNPPMRITHIPGDDQVRVTLFVRASHPQGAAVDAGAYSATASLTVSWIGP
jgi:hypothetical protein